MRNQTLMFFITYLLLSHSVLGKSNESIENIMGPNECAECHEDEARIWNKSHHAKSYKTLQRDKDAKEIAKALGVRRIKTSENCVGCHYTQVIKTNNRTKSIAGVGCESCHGAAKNWYDIHSDYGGKNITKVQESAAHKQKRLTKSIDNGFHFRGTPYSLFEQCYGCHTINDEALINKTKHPTGNKFELVAWSSGEVRHNVFYNQGRSNPVDKKEWQRLKFVLGQLLDLQYSIRALDKSTKKGKYTDILLKRIKSKVENLSEINKLISDKNINTILDGVLLNEVNYGNKDKIVLMADVIEKETKEFLKKYEKKKLPSIDKLIPGPEKFKGEVQN